MCSGASAMGGKEEQIAAAALTEANVTVAVVQESKMIKGSATTTATTPVIAESKEVTLKELACRMAAFAAAREWDQFHSPRNLLLALVTSTPHPVGWFSTFFQN